MKSSSKALRFLGVVFLLGYLDWLTTVIGLFCGGTELNPLLAGLTNSSILTFTITKLTAVAVTGFTAYKAVDIAKCANKNGLLISNLVNGGFLLTAAGLCIVVANNVMIVFQL